MKKTNPNEDNIIPASPGDTQGEARSSGEAGSPLGDPAAQPPSAATWTARLKRRWNSMLAWLAQGAEHACPT